jgi:hypothetical protein
MLMDRPAEIDPGPCELCGCTMDQHEGPELYCDDVEREIYLSACALVRKWEMDDPRDRWRHTGEPRPEAAAGVPSKPPYRTAQSTIDAFWYAAGLNDADCLSHWLAQHPLDVTALRKLWEAKHAGA